MDTLKPPDAERRRQLIMDCRPELLSPAVRDFEHAKKVCMEVSGSDQLCASLHIESVTEKAVPKIAGVCETCRRKLREKGIDIPCEEEEEWVR